jgi:type IV pilus assembly protein PilA
MKQKGFTLIELLVVVAIIGILAAVGLTAFNGFIASTKVNATQRAHGEVVRFIKTSIMKCHIGSELVLSAPSGWSSGNLCNSVTTIPNANSLNVAFKFYFDGAGFCNTYGLMHATSGTCMEGVALGGAGPGGNIGEIRLTQNITNNVIIVDTYLRDGDYLIDSITIE